MNARANHSRADAYYWENEVRQASRLRQQVAKVSISLVQSPRWYYRPKLDHAVESRADKRISFSVRMKELFYIMETQCRIAVVIVSCLLIISQADAREKVVDRVVVKAGSYLVISRTQGDTGIALLAKVHSRGELKVIAEDENIAPKIERFLPQVEAFELIKQMVALDIKSAGGVRKKQEEIDKLSMKFGKGTFNYLTSMQIEAYRVAGVHIPH